MNLGLYKNSHSTNFHLYKYKNYQEYKDIQVHFNKEKIHKIWADKQVLSAVAKRILIENFPAGGGFAMEVETALNNSI